MRMMQMTVNQVVYVITVGHSFVATARAVNMVRIVTTALVVRGAISRIVR
jgi:hypothetical protein